MLLSHTLPYLDTPHIQHINERSDLLPTTLLPTYTPIVVQAKPSTHLDRNSKIAIGVIITLVVYIFSYIIHTYFQKRREQALQVQHIQPDIESQRTVFSQRNSILGSISGGRWRSSYHDSNTIGKRRRLSVTIVNETPKQREKRWWGSVAAHGSAVKADAEVPLHSQPSYPKPVRSLPKAYDDEGESPGTWNDWGYEWEGLGNGGRGKARGLQATTCKKGRMGLGPDMRPRSIGTGVPRARVKRQLLARSISSATV